MDKAFWFSTLLALFAVLSYFMMRFLPGKSKAENILPRLYISVVFSGIFLGGLYFIAPEQAQVVYYKFALAIAATILGVILDRLIFPYSRPDGYLKYFWQHGSKEKLGEADYELVAGYELVFAIAMLRRTLIVIAVVLGATLGL
mgnify:CR=1 FL=1